MDRNSTNFNDNLYYILGYYSELQTAETSYRELEGALDRFRAESEFDVILIELDFNRFEKMLGKDIEENYVYALMYDLEAERMWYVYPDNPDNPEKVEKFFVVVSK